MAEMIKVSLFSPERPLAEVDAKSLQVPALLGDMGVLPGHASMITELGLGELKIESNAASDEQRYFVSGGYMEVAQDSVKVLVDVVERIEEIDVSRAQKAEERAEKRLKDTLDINLDIARALASLERAKARKKLARTSK